MLIMRPHRTTLLLVGWGLISTVTIATVAMLSGIDGVVAKSAFGVIGLLVGYGLGYKVKVNGD